MPEPYLIRPNNNRHQPDIPVDDVSGAAIVNLYVYDSVANEYVDAGAVLRDIQRSVSDQEARFDYGVRSDYSPVYVGKALQGTASSEPVWLISKFDYDGVNRVTRVQVLVGAWDSRDSLDWS